MSRAARLAQQATSVLDEADAENRVLSAEERTYVRGLLDQAKELKGYEQSFQEIGYKLGGGNRSGDGSFEASGGGTDPGSRFINSDAYKAIRDPASRGSEWSTGPIELTSPRGMMMKGTLLEGTGAPGSGSGGGLIPVPQVVPGVVDVLFQPLTAERALSGGQATGPTVRYVYQGTATSAAAGVAEGQTKPESTLGLATRDESIRKVATTVTISDEILNDAPAVQMFVNQQLLQFVNIEVERELLRGTAGGAEIQGLLTSRGVPVYAGGTAVGNKAEQLFRALNSVRGSAFVEPDFAIVNFQDYEQIRLLKDNQGQLYAGGPFFGPYSSPTMAGASGQITGATDQLWGKNVYVTSALGAGTAVVGSSQAARVMSLGGARVEMSAHHSDYFQRDLVLVRCERRLGLCLFRSNAIVEVHLA